jgi:hypothetical protein
MKIRMQETSLEAWDQWQGKPSAEVDLKIMKALWDAGSDGLMCWQIEEKIDRGHQTVSGNITHLKKKGDIVQTDRRGLTRSRRPAFFLVHCNFADESDGLPTRPEPEGASERQGKPGKDNPQPGLF